MNNLVDMLLSGNVIYETIFGESPIGLAYLGDKPDIVERLLAEEEAVFLQRIAWEMVQEFLAQQ